jgi:hypothetical protein
MNKLFAVVLSVLFVVAAAAPIMATESRQIALGGVGNYIEDDYNIFAWPATLPSYSNTVWLSIAQARLERDWPGYTSWDSLSGPATLIGASYGLGSEHKYGTVAMFLYDKAPGLNPVMGGVFSSPLQNKLTLMYAYAAEKFSLGFFVVRSDQGNTSDTPAEEDHHSYTSFGAGLRFDIGEKAYMDFAFDLSMGAYQDELFPIVTGVGDTVLTSISEDANMMWGAKARIFYEVNETVTLVPYVGLRKFDFSLKADTLQALFLPGNTGDKAMMFDIGFGANVKVNEDNLLVFAIEPISWLKWEPSALPATAQEVSLDQKVIPRFFLALESDVRDWLTFRAGAHKSLVKTEYKNIDIGGVTLNRTDTGASFNYFMGLGFHVSDFDIDCVINNDLPLRLGYWLTGYSGAQGYPVYMVSSTYHF